MSQWKLIVTCLTLSYLINCSNDKYASFPVIQTYQNENHRYIFTNKGDGFFIGNSHRENLDRAEGWQVGNICYLNDYRIYFNRQPVNRDSVNEFRYYPFSLIRRYTNGFQETFTVLDSINALWWEFDFSDSDKNLQFELMLNRDAGPLSFVLSSENDQILVPPSVFSHTNCPDNPLWLAASLKWEDNHKAHVICALEKDTATVKKALKSHLIHSYNLKERRTDRLKNLIKKNNLYTNLPEVTDAVAWAQISLDGLFTEWGDYGIKAGIPLPFRNLARETFIAFSSALLIPGKFQKAKSILQIYADHQFADENNIYYGRIPSQLSARNINYNSADVTWLYIKAFYEYLLYTADLSFAEQIFPILQKAVNGALRYRVDKNFFIIHSAGETWMNEGTTPYRGNRAVEIQVLWYSALQIAAYIARLTHRDNFSEHWLAIANTMHENFQKHFWNAYNYQIYDFLNPDGSHDKRVRPNQIFTVCTTNMQEIHDLISLEAQGHIINTVLTKLTYYFGVSTLWQKDKDFFPCYYPNASNRQNGSLYNGMVWNWLTGPVIRGLLTVHYSDLAYELFYNQGKQILEGEAIASIGKWPREWTVNNECDPNNIGTISYASSLAEFIRNFYSDFIGYLPVAPDSTIYFTPKLPEELRYIAATLPFKEDNIRYEFLNDVDKRECNLVISRISGNDPIKAKIQIPGFDPVQFLFSREITSHSFRFNLDFRRSDKVLPQMDWHFAIPQMQD